jgi:hypothetical protein
MTEQIRVYADAACSSMEARRLNSHEFIFRQEERLFIDISRWFFRLDGVCKQCSEDVYKGIKINPVSGVLNLPMQRPSLRKG